MKLLIDVDEETYVKAQAGILGSFGTIIANGKPYEERPQGEWITHQAGMLLWEECNQCHAQVGTVGMNFCPNCGSDMRNR